MKFMSMFLLSIVLACVGCPTPISEEKPAPVEQETEETTEEETITDDDSSAPEGDSSEPTSDSSEEPEESPITWTECSGKPGEKACDFTFVDQNGDAWSLYDHYGTVIVLDFSAMWCGPCNTLAADVQAHQDYYTSDGHDVLFVSVLIDGPTWGTPPTAEQIQDWVTSYGMTTSPVIAADRSIIDTTAEDGYPITSWPVIVVIDETLTIHNGVRGWSESMVYGWIDEILGITR